MRFYAVDWWSPDLGPMRSHHASKREALKEARSVQSDSYTEVEVRRIAFRGTLAEWLQALDAAANLGSEGPTGYPGEWECVWRAPGGQ